MVEKKSSNHRKVGIGLGVIIAVIIIVAAFGVIFTNPTPILNPPKPERSWFLEPFLEEVKIVTKQLYSA